MVRLLKELFQESLLFLFSLTLLSLLLILTKLCATFNFLVYFHLILTAICFHLLENEQTQSNSTPFLLVLVNLHLKSKIILIQM